jgi:DNA-binding transcriptional regulator of glucitol operon
MTAAVIVLIVMIWCMAFYLGFLLIDVKHDLRAMRRCMDQIANRKIR